MWMMHGYPYYYRMGPRFDFFGIIFVFFFILFIVWLISRIFHRDTATENEKELTEEETALQILKKRYARGEITKRQFLEIKKDIG